MNIKKWDAYRVYMFFAGAEAFALTLVFTIDMVYLVETVGLNPLQLVLVGTALEMTAFFFEAPTGGVADVYSRRLSVIIGVMLLGCGFLVIGAIPKFGFIILAQVITGIGYTFISGAAAAWLADEIGEERAGKGYLHAKQIGQLTAIAGIILSVALASIHIQLAILTGGATLLAVALTLMVVMPEDGFAPTPRGERETFGVMKKTLNDGVRMVKRRPVLLTILSITFVVGAFSEGFDRLWTAHILENFSFPQIGNFDSIVWFGVIELVSLAIGATVTEVVRRRVQTSSHASVARVLFWINGLLIGAVVVFALSHNLLLALIAYWTIGPLRGVYYPLQTAWINQGIDPKVRATVLSITAQTDALGQISGGPGIGFVGNTFGVRTALALGGFILLPAMGLYSRTIRIGDSTQLAENAAKP
jgi:DHA3 family tetracycline resistance protein-like MFS transporter